MEKNTDLYFEQICEDVLQKKNVNSVTGGLRNTSFVYNFKGQRYFVKKYNSDTKYSRHMSESKCVSEFCVTQYLFYQGCDVAKPLFYDEEKQIGIYEYLEAENLFAHGTIGQEECFKVIDSISKVHRLPVKGEIGICRFKELAKEDIYRYLCEGFEFLKEIMGKEVDIDKTFFERVAERISLNERVLGNTQLHDGNVMITNDNRIYLCDFEKVFPHFPQMDIMSFINCRRLGLEDEKEIIDYYLRINNVQNANEFYAVYNLLFIIDSLRMIKKIKYNEDGLKVKWIEENGVRHKRYEKTDLEKGRLWNRERGESIERRLNGILKKEYSKDPQAEKLRNMVREVTDAGSVRNIAIDKSLYFHECELKFRVESDMEKQAYQQRLLESGFEKEDEILETDYVPDTDQFECKKNGMVLRVRQISGGKNDMLVTLKLRNQNDKIQDNYEVEFYKSQFDAKKLNEISRILNEYTGKKLPFGILEKEELLDIVGEMKRNGFSETRMLSQKKRTNYRRYQITVSFDTFPGSVGTYMEIEASNPEMLEKFVNDMDLEMEKVEPLNYGKLIQKKQQDLPEKLRRICMFQ